MRKKRILIGLTLAGVLILLAIVAGLVSDANRWRGKFERSLGTALRARVRIGRAEGSLLLSRTVTLNQVECLWDDGSSLSCRNASIVFGTVPALSRRLHVREAILVEPDLKIVSSGEKRSGNGNAPPEPSPTRPSDERHEVSAPERLSVLSGRIFWTDPASGTEYLATGIRATASEIRCYADGPGTLPSEVTFSAAVRVQHFQGNGIEVSDAVCAATAEHDTVTVRVSDGALWGGHLSGRFALKKKESAVTCTVNGTVSDLSAQSLLKSFSQQLSLQGAASMSADASWTGTTVQKFLETVVGTVSLRGRDLYTPDLNLDELLTRIERSTRFTLLDAGAYFFAGPLGAAVTKGRDLAALRSGGLGKDGYVRELASVWQLGAGAADARDVALATNASRIALKGKLDIVNRRFDSVRIASVDRNGIARFSQEVIGSFSEPKIERVHPVKALAQPLVSTVKAAGRLTGIARTKPFYSGSVMHPRQKESRPAP